MDFDLPDTALAVRGGVAAVAELARLRSERAHALRLRAHFCRRRLVRVLPPPLLVVVRHPGAHAPRGPGAL